MKNKTSYKINKKHKVVYVSFEGDIYSEDIKNILMTTSMDPDYNSNYDNILDFRFCTLKVNIQELKPIASFVKNKLNTDAKRASIYITDQPNQVVLTTLFSKVIKDFKMKPHVVSTIDKAYHLLSHTEIDIELFTQNINDLRLN